MKILLTGSQGQLGSSILETKPKEILMFRPNRNKLNLLDSEECFKTVLDLNPDWIINCGAYTSVDSAETNSKNAFKINTEAPKAFAKALKITGGKLLQISTDYVFNGRQNIPYLNTQPKDPISIYGKSKALAEDNIIKELDNLNNFYILRTSWLIGSTGQNFASKIISLHSKKDKIKIVSDQIGSSTTTYSLCKVIWEIIKKEENEKKLKEGVNPIIHWSDDGIASWYDLAIAISDISFELGLIDQKVFIEPIKSISYANSSIRPIFSKLDCEYTKETFGVKGVYWRESLHNLLKMKLN